MGGIPDEVEGCEPHNDDDKDGKMDKEPAHRRFCELELLWRRPSSFRHQTIPCYPTRRISRTFGRGTQRTTRAVTLLSYMEKDWSSHGNPTLICINMTSSWLASNAGTPRRAFARRRPFRRAQVASILNNYSVCPLWVIS
jgi:hypothetical protein